MTRIFRYILQTDTGMAPCIDSGLVSLAICKPKIRASAKIGDWVIGFYARPAPRGLVTWAGRISDQLDTGRYESTFRGRSDAVYRQQRDGTFKRLRPDYHSGADEIRKDLSAPSLIFDQNATWYFGDQPKVLPHELMHLAAGGQGHRVNARIEGDLQALQIWLTSIGSPGVHGKPRHLLSPIQTPRRC